MDYRIDEVDRRVLYYLALDARNTTASEIADELDVSDRTIRNRIDQLEDHGFIRGYHANVDYERVDNRMTNLFVCSAPVPEREAIAKEALAVPGVVNVRELMTGRGNLHVLGVGTSTDDISRIARELADLGVEIADEALVQREFFHPYHQFGPDGGQARTLVTDSRRLAGDAEVVDVRVLEGSPLVGMELREVAEEGVLGEDVLVVAIERADRILTPKGGTEIRAGDLITLVSREGVPNEAVHAFTGGG